MRSAARLSAGLSLVIALFVLIFSCLSVTYLVAIPIAAVVFLLAGLGCIAILIVCSVRLFGRARRSDFTAYGKSKRALVWVAGVTAILYVVPVFIWGLSPRDAPLTAVDAVPAIPLIVAIAFAGGTLVIALQTATPELWSGRLDKRY